MFNFALNYNCPYCGNLNYINEEVNNNQISRKHNQTCQICRQDYTVNFEATISVKKKEARQQKEHVCPYCQTVVPTFHNVTNDAKPGIVTCHDCNKDYMLAVDFLVMSHKIFEENGHIYARINDGIDNSGKYKCSIDDMQTLIDKFPKYEVRYSYFYKIYEEMKNLWLNKKEFKIETTKCGSYVCVLHSSMSADEIDRHISRFEELYSKNNSWKFDVLCKARQCLMEYYGKMNEKEKKTKEISS